MRGNVHPYFDGAPLVLAHRGASADAPENTLSAFQLAVEQGADVIETDVHATRDGVPVLIHDARVDRTTDGTGAVASRSLAELERLDAGARFGAFRGRGVAIPTLEHALATFPGVRFNLELKSDGPGDLVGAVTDVVRRARRERDVLLTSEDAARMHRLRAAAAGAALGASRDEVAAWVRAAMTGDEPAPGPMALQLPIEHEGMLLVTPALVALAHARGVAVHVWTVNDAAEMRRLLDLGVDGIVTDEPRRLVHVLRRG